MVTLKDIAAICNVSVATVSNVINGKGKTSEKTAKMIMRVVEEKGYRPNAMARGLRMRRTNMISVIAEDLAQFTTPPIVSGIMRCCEEKGYSVILNNLRLYDRWSDTWYNQEKEYHSILDPVLQDVQYAGVDGVIYLAGHARKIRVEPENPPIPCVMAYAYPTSDYVPYVVIDEENSAQEMTRYIISKGHRRIGFVGGRYDNVHTKSRLEGYQRALFEADIPCDPNLIYYGNWDRKSGYEAARKFVDLGVTACFAISDRMAGGVYDYLIENDMRAGVDLSVAGFDNEAISSYLNPPLTTMMIPLHEIGRISAALLLDKIAESTADDGAADKKTKGTVIKMPCSFIERRSVAEI